MTTQYCLEWPDLPAAQQPTWPDPDALATARASLATFPPLVFAGECDILRHRLAEAARGEAFVLMGGDCAETFAAATADNIRDRVKTILQMAAVLTYGSSTPVVKLGRLAGQYAKPRSKDTEQRDDEVLPAYRGDMVNDFAFTPEARQPDPDRLVRAYHASAATLNLVRAFTQGGFADLRHVHDWNRGFIANSANRRYERMANDIDKAMRFMTACGADFEAMRRVDVWASHEALLLDYEKPLTRIDSRTGQPYGTSGHFLWVGERTRDVAGAHVDFVSRIRNPIGVKLGPTAKADDLLRLADRVDPDREPGRLSIIVRMGAHRVQEGLPPLVEAARAEGLQPTWICDPMHGNTFESASGYKTRRFDDIVAEVRGFFDVHRGLGSWPGGIHVELTGNDVTECLGGSIDLHDEDLQRRYETACDPRLNHQQSLELAFIVAEMLAS
ncbi:Phospho-2-dehydro-3-deoxyheptonate aldolase [Austwickia sp. TVS 96-490-7B]|uniref:class II 3-deoxy-7-phosphoheptulonate synthase n=1 Tax=Austwickia sp. TVS 96-490-7B TaxID=2830843 RepID=UPI001C59F07B|nr:3-deoxy-7-phosphoheptulonate synthase class II [Austwickia sp. TVS 96-490-7B]MBW3086110.1 Phospho-2-dehydro-3-deoxyheptonate aldolase [Austwickia sp. TVS 96-490-7B]